ncbi:MAG: SDR family NAD(P)-dependent oxidoreductase [Pirellulaceae bacterium]
MWYRYNVRTILENDFLDLHLTNQVTLVFGGASGIGRAIAREFAAEGASVAILDRSSGTAQAATEIATETRALVTGLVCDATDYSQVQSAVIAVQQQFGRPRHMVYAAGMGSGKFGFPFWNLKPADWQRVLDVNLIGAVNAAHALGPLLADAKQGTMLFISSVAGQIGSQTDPPYSAAKAGLINFAQCAAKDLAKHNVRVNTICPGMVQTPLNKAVWQAWHDQQPVESRQSYEEWAGTKVKAVCPLGRWQTPDDICQSAGKTSQPSAGENQPF